MAVGSASVTCKNAFSAEQEQRPSCSQKGVPGRHHGKKSLTRAHAHMALWGPVSQEVALPRGWGML